MNANCIFWFRRDLTLDDNIGLFHALRENKRVLPIFIFDKSILNNLKPDDKRIPLIYDLIKKLKKELINLNSNMEIIHDTPENYFQNLPKGVKKIYTNHDYEPYATERDNKIKEILHDKDVDFITFKNQVIFEKDDIVKDDGGHYSVFTPYMNKWKSKFSPSLCKPVNVKEFKENLHSFSPGEFDYETLGFESNPELPTLEIDKDIMETYDRTRDYPAQQGTTKLSFALRFGAISIRKLVLEAYNTNETYLNELIWREFYMMILWFNPHVVDKSFKPKYDNIPWSNDEEKFKKWCQGKTGVPIVDAGMRELNTTGYMHNRVRMIVASFLTKNLLIDWRWGEAYFAEKLLDYELSSNNGGWQWAASSGCDAAPYFRIFNPISQAKKYDPDTKYINKWVPEIKEGTYPTPIVDVKQSRKRAIEVYKKVV